MTKKKIIDHASRAKAKWDRELGRWQTLQEQIWSLEAERRLQQERIHKAYQRYLDLTK